MNRPKMSITHMRTAVAVLSLALFAQTAVWLVYDIADRGIPGAWAMWTGGFAPGLSATSRLDLGIAALQLAAGWATLRQARGAGGLLVTACATTLAFRAPVLWYVLLDSPSDPWFGTLKGPSLTVVGLTCVLAIVLALALGALLLLVRHMEDEAVEAAVSEELRGGAIRPVKVTATASGALLAVLNVFYIGRNAVTAYQVGPRVLTDLIVGKGTGRAVLGVSSPFQWVCLTVLCGLGMFLAVKRRPVATGVSVGLALFMMPSSFAQLWGSIVDDTVQQSALGSAQNLLEVVGSAAVVALIYGDVRRDHRAADDGEVGAARVPAAASATPVERAVPAGHGADAEPVEA
ncbi:hypothetical protein ACWCQN_15270 [Streptomyces sp. NPDC001984]|uniref:hypothetical protein n=1 Tax=Streptomyces sp. NPDC002619 TaxID=3364655 RepID=UPI0036922C8C